MIYSIIIFAILFVYLGVLHGVFKAHKSTKSWVKVTHFWGEVAGLVQGMIIVNDLLKLI